MKGTSKVIMGATLLAAVSLAIVLGLVLVLLLELHCSLLLLRRRRLRNSATTTNTTTAADDTSSLPTTQTQEEQSPIPLGSFYAHGVLDAPPRSFLFPPAVSSKENKVDMKKKKNQRSFQLHHSVLDIHTLEPNTATTDQSSPSTSFFTSTPQPIQETTTTQMGCSNCARKDKACGGDDGIDTEHFIYLLNPIYISNPIYDNDDDASSRTSRAGTTPFETPHTSPSRLESCGGYSVEDGISQSSATSSPQSVPSTPPLTPMKKLPAEACSISLRDARSLDTSGSDSVSNNGHSSSSSESPCTSPSW